MHRRGLCGHGVVVALSDSGIAARGFVARQGYAWSGAVERYARHGTAMACLIWSIAPEAVVHAVAWKPDPLLSLVRAAELGDVVLAAWGMAGVDTDAALVRSLRTPVVSVDDPRRPLTPGRHLPKAVRLVPRHELATCQFRLPGEWLTLTGASVAAALATGAAAVLVSAGVPPTDAVDHVLTHPSTDWWSLL